MMRHSHPSCVPATAAMCLTCEWYRVYRNVVVADRARTEHIEANGHPAVVRALMVFPSEIEADPPAVLHVSDAWLHTATAGTPPF